MDSRNVPNINNVPKKTKGRKNIEMKKISNKRNLQVTFSKRRTRLFKAASELVTLCGVDVAIIMFSPGNRVFSFANPNLDSIIQRYMTQGPPLLDLNEAPSTMDDSELHKQLKYLSNQIDGEQQRVEDLNHLLKATKDKFWWATPIESMKNIQVEKYHKMLLEFKSYVNDKRKNLLFESSFTQNSSNQVFVCGSSSSNVNNTVNVCP